MKSAVAVLLVVVLLTAPVVIAVKPVCASSQTWTQTYGSPDNDFAFALAATSDGGYAIVGSTGSTIGSTQGYVWLVKADADGYELWNRTYGIIGKTHGYYVVQTVDGGYAIVGSNASSSDNRDVWLLKTDADGNELWNQTYGGAEDDNALSLVQNSDGGYTIAGTTGSFSGGNSDFWLIKTDAAGNELWNQTYGGPEIDLARSLVQTSDDGYAILGITRSFGAGGVDFWLVKTDADGMLQWSQTYGGPADDFALNVVETSDSGYALIGNTLTYGAGDFDFWLIKTDSTGNELWNQTYGGPESDSGLSLVQSSDGGYALTGSTTSYGAGGQDFWLVKTDADGNALWNQTYGGPDGDGAYSLVKTDDGGYAIVGTTESYGVGGQDFWLIKTDEYGVVPEATWVVLPLMLAATLAIFITKKKLLHPRTPIS